jgi:rod shape-determining protein MreC
MRFIYTKAFAIFAACVVLTAVLAVFQAKGWLGSIRTAALEAPRPVIILVEDITLPVKNFFSTVYSLRSITQENSQLKAQVSQLQQQLAQYQEESRENDALRAELGFVQNSKQALAPCTVLSENPFGMTDALVLNCGSGDGVDVGEAVISQGYLVGKIIYSTDHSSTALLVTDANFSTDARVSQTNATAIVKGSFGSGIILDQVPQTSDLKNGWLIVTAGINAQIPKGILIGEVGNILSGGSDLFKQAALASPIDFNNLQFVFVVKE